jgi:acyl-CoA reductase-like NAD-dependent aldehyde dehydrogenase
LADVKPWMKVFEEETFWPVAPITKAKDIEDAIYLANASKFGLASTVVTQDKEKFDYVASKLETWNVFWNKIPTSYPFLPYGWIKNSGYGKELWERWMKNFTNEKVIVY